MQVIDELPVWVMDDLLELTRVVNMLDDWPELK